MSNVDALRPEHIAQAAISNDVGRRMAGPLVESRILLPSVFVTLVAVAIAGLSGWGMWRVYMAAPWTRDGAVRVYVVTMAPEVGGRIVTLPVADNQFVRKGDELFEIDPADYRIALDQAQALTQRDSATLDYARKNEKRKAVLTKDGWASTDVYQQTTSTVGQSEGAVALDNAAVAKAQLDLKRTVIGRRPTATLRICWCGSATMRQSGKRSFRSSTRIRSGSTATSRRPRLEGSMRATAQTSS